MNLEQFRAGRAHVNHLADDPRMADTLQGAVDAGWGKDTPGIVYPGGLFIAESEFDQKPAYCLHIGNIQQMRFQDAAGVGLAELEEQLYRFAVEEGYVESEPADNAPQA